MTEGYICIPWKSAVEFSPWLVNHHFFSHDFITIFHQFLPGDLRMFFAELRRQVHVYLLELLLELAPWLREFFFVSGAQGGQEVWKEMWDKTITNLPSGNLT